MDPNHIWSEIDSKVVPVDPADCEDCDKLLPEGVCLNHFMLGVPFPSAQQ